MIRALGFSHTEFNPSKPGRLCRGRERWIEPWPTDEPPPTIHRLVISGAAFNDDSAADALRGVTQSGVDLSQIIATLFPRKRMMAFCEDGHPADIPAEAQGIEAYEGYRAGGMTQVGLVRWYEIVQGVREIRAVIGNPTDEKICGLAVLDDDTDEAALWEQLFLLVGMSTLDSPPARFQPAALDSVLDLVRAVVLLHRDKHGPSLGIYSKSPIKTDGRLAGLCEAAESLLVPFAIPPMLARWDRALSELRQDWIATHDDEFPVPPAPEHQSWEQRRRGRRSRRRDSDEQMASDEWGPASDALEAHGAEE